MVDHSLEGYQISNETIGVVFLKSNSLRSKYGHEFYGQGFSTVSDAAGSPGTS